MSDTETESATQTQPTSRRRRKRRRISWGWTAYFIGVVIVSVGLYCVFNPGWVAFRKGEFALERGDYASALRDLERARELGVRTRHSAVQLASVLLKLDRPSDAAVILDPYRRDTPPDSAAISLLAGIYAADQRPADGVHVFLDAIEVGYQPDAVAAVQLGDLYRQVERLADAEGWYQVAIDSGDAETQLAARTQLAELRAWTGAYDASLELIDEILASDPSNRKVRTLRARVLSWAGRNRESAEEYRKILAQ